MLIAPLAPSPGIREAVFLMSSLSKRGGLKQHSAVRGEKKKEEEEKRSHRWETDVRENDSVSTKKKKMMWPSSQDLDVLPGRLLGIEMCFFKYKKTKKRRKPPALSLLLSITLPASVV